MKKTAILMLSMMMGLNIMAQIDLSKKIPGINYASEYHFGKAVEMSFDFYTRKGDFQMNIPYSTYYQDGFDVFCVKHQRGNTVYQTLFDMPKNNLLVILGEGDQIMGSAAAMKDTSKKELITLPLTKTDQRKNILDIECIKYTFNTDRIYGELWVAPSLSALSNRVGVLKASKMAMFYQVVPVDGFVMEIVSYTKRGKKTLMTTTAINKTVDYTVKLPEEFGVAINKVDYYDY